MHNTSDIPGQVILPATGRPELLSNVFVKNYGELKSKGNFSYDKINMELNLHLVHSGRGRLEYNDEVYYPEANDIFILFPRNRTRYHDYPDSPWHYSWLTITIPEDFPLLSSLIVTNDNPIARLDKNSTLPEIIRRTGKRLKSRDYQPVQAVKAAWEILEALTAPKTIKSLSLAENIRNAIDTAEYPPEINELAERFSVDRSTIYRAFKEKYGQSVKNYIDEAKFVNVCDLLNNTSYPINQIARYCGFDSPHYFARAFKTRYGMKPSEFRRRKIHQQCP